MAFNLGARARARRRRVLICCMTLALLGGTSIGLAGPREQAKRIHDRLTGTPPAPAVLDSMAAKITAGRAVDAALEAIETPAFYNTTLKNFATPWTNEARTIYAPLNDFSATVIGVVRDELPFTELLSGDIVYVGGTGVADVAYSHIDNAHYESLENNGVDLSNPANLVRSAQSTLPDTQLTADSAAGVITTRAFGEAYFKAGTNRRAWRFIGVNFLCRDMEALHDIARPADRVRQDVTRSPGGDSSVYLNYCVGCHAGMDALAGAFAHYEFDEELNRLIYTPDSVQDKYLINSTTFPQGFRTVDDSWVNYWRSGQNAVLGWQGPAASGTGAKSLGVEVASSAAFAQCQVEQVFEKVCFHPPNSTADFSAVDRMTNSFITNNYNLKRVFAETAVYCMGP